MSQLKPKSQQYQLRPVQKGEQSLQVIPQIQLYKNYQKPEVSQQKKISIQDKLQLQKEALHNARDRENNSDFYLKFNLNPFMEYKGRDHQIMQQYLRDTKEPTINVVDKLAEMKDNPPKIKKIAELRSLELDEMKDNFSMLSDKLINIVQRGQKGQKTIQNNQKPVVKKSPDKPAPKVNNSVFDKKLQQEQSQMKPQILQFLNVDIDAIVAIREQNFFLKRQKKINAFKVAHDEQDQISSKQILRKFYFCNSSMAQKICKIKIPIYRDISSLSRKIMVGEQTSPENIIDYIDSVQMSFKLKQLLYMDIMSVISNRFSPQFLYRMMNNQDAIVKQGSDASSEQRDDLQIMYHQNQINKETNFVNINQQLQEIKDYQKLSYNESQEEYHHQLTIKKQRIMNHLHLRQNLRRKAVNDMHENQKVQNVVKQQFQQFVNMEKQPILEISKLVRSSKLSKNKNQGIKMKILIETLACKNRHEEHMGQINNGI